MARTYMEHLISTGYWSRHFLTISFDLRVGFITSRLQVRKLSYIRVEKLASAHVSSHRQN